MAVIVGSDRTHGATLLSLEEARQRAVASSDLLKAAQGDVDIAKAKRLQSWSGHLPSLRLATGFARTNDAVGVFGTKLRQEQFVQSDFDLDALNKPTSITNYESVIEASQPLFTSGRSRATRYRAGAEVDAAAAEFGRARQRLRLETEAAYWDLVVAREGRVDAAQSRFEQETISRADLLNAQVRVSELEAREIAAVNRVANGNDLLCTMTGSSADLAEILPTDSLRLQSLQTPFEEVATLALAQRLDLRADELRTRAAAAGVRAAQASRLPRIDAFARLQLDADELLERQGESWSVGTKATWDLFSGFHHEGAVRQARAGKARSDAMRDHRHRQVQLEARRAHRDVTAARARYDVTTDATTAARERLRITGRRHDEGMATVAEVLDAEADLTAMRLKRLEALHAINMSLAHLEFAVGAHLSEGEIK